MHPAPGWKKGGDPVEPGWKVELLRWLGHTFNLRVLVETGTCEGKTVQALSRDFGRIDTVELHARFAMLARKRLAGLRHVRVWEGDSPSALPAIFAELDPGPLLIYLDAHPTGNGETTWLGDPLPEELRVIDQLRPESLVVIDDESEPDLKRVAAAGVDLEPWTRLYMSGMVVMHRGGFQVPPLRA